MASIKYTGIVSGIKGSIAGTTFQAGTASNIIRAKTTYNRQGLSNQSLNITANNRSAMALVSQTWQTLSDDERTAFATAAPLFPATNKFGDVYTPSAYQLYSLCNLNLLAIGQSLTSTAPVLETFPDLSGLEVLINDAGTYDIDWTTAAPSGFSAMVFGTYSVSTGMSLRLNLLKLLGVQDISGLNIFSFYPQYTAKFGAPLQLLRQFTAVKVVSQTTGIAAGRKYITAIVGSV